MISYVRVFDLMTRDVVRLNPQGELVQAMDLLVTNRISGAPVVDGNDGIVGILTQKDCVRAALQCCYHQEWGGEVSDYMSREVVTLQANLDLVGAAEKFLETPYRLFPVLREQALVGMLSRSDVLRALAVSWGELGNRLH